MEAAAGRQPASEATAPSVRSRRAPSLSYRGGRAWIKGAQAAKRSGIPGVTGWSEHPRGGRKNGWRQDAALFPGAGAGKPVESRLSVPACCCRLRPAVTGRLSWVSGQARRDPPPEAVGIPEIWSFCT